MVSISARAPSISCPHPENRFRHFPFALERSLKTDSVTSPVLMLSLLPSRPLYPALALFPSHHLLPSILLSLASLSLLLFGGSGKQREEWSGGGVGGGGGGGIRRQGFGLRVASPWHCSPPALLLQPLFMREREREGERHTGSGHVAAVKYLCACILFIYWFSCTHQRGPWGETAATLLLPDSGHPH